MKGVIKMQYRNKIHEELTTFLDGIGRRDEISLTVDSGFLAVEFDVRIDNVSVNSSGILFVDFNEGGLAFDTGMFPESELTMEDEDGQNMYAMKRKDCVACLSVSPKNTKL